MNAEFYHVSLFFPIDQLKTLFFFSKPQSAESHLGEHNLLERDVLDFNFKANVCQTNRNPL